MGSDEVRTTQQLIEAARAVCGAFALGHDLAAAAVGAALRTASGAVYTGVSVELACGLGVCAEVAAVVEMLKHRETRISEIVAVKGERIIPPCGRCRETLVQVDARNLDTRVLLSPERSVALRELLPEPWTSARRAISDRGDADAGAGIGNRDAGAGNDRG